MAGLLLAPLVEQLFGLLTRSRLLELADVERPLLRRLSCEAPGTFEHTLMIAGLAEEGARAIGADVDLVRTGSLYHDVGKLHGPQWFIENQTEGENPHDRLDDPQASAAILQAHVDEGLRLARRYRLPRPLADFIPEHQGTLKMGFFLHQARERDPAVPESAFRYRGPRPRSRETAILMLADGCEAALRSLPPDTSDQQAREMVRRLIEARLVDGQLALSGLTRSELELVIRAFVRVWRRMRHRRIPYPIAPRRAFSA
jgi:putative nucleotidyltransferase with HDIG domain